MPDWGRFSRTAEAKEAVRLVRKELWEKGIEVRMCIDCGELTVEIRKPISDILEHKCPFFP